MDEFDLSTAAAPAPGTMLRQHPGLVISLTYLVVSLIGLLFSYSLFSEFGINIFLYAEISDFLLGALREPMTFLAAGAAVLTVLLLHGLARLELRFFRRHPPTARVGKAYLRLSQAAYSSQWTWLLVFILYSYLFLSLYGNYRSEQIKAGHGEVVQIYIAEGTDSDGSVKPGGRTGLLLGTTNKFIFVYDPETGSTDVIPNESIIRIVIAGKAPEEKEQDQ